ncbi:MAG: hypothetical protein LUF89_10915 [Ruminococcus sp.]|nr:hypothetical protein [Ruminococcus sp.]
MFKWKKAAALLLAGAVAGLLAGCGSSTAYAMTIDGVQIRAGMYIYYSYAAYSELTFTLSSENSELDVTDDDVVKAQTMDDVSAEDWIENKTLEYCQQYAAIQNKCDELSITLDDDDLTEISDTIDSFWETYGETYESNGISSESIELVLKNSYLTNELFYYYYDIDGAEGVTEEEIQEYYIENNARVRYIAFDLTDGNGEELDDDGKDDMMDMVTEYLERLEDCDGDADEINAEMDTIESEYDAYVTSISEEAAAETATSETDEDGNEIAAMTTTTTTTTAEETTSTTTVEETEEDEAETTAVADDSSDTETTTTSDENDADTSVTTTTTTTTESEEDESEDETTTETETPYENESIIAKVTTDEDTEEEDITYTPSEAAYNYIFSDDIEFGVPGIVEDEDNNCIYLIVRLDIEDRMTEDDLWTEDNIDTVISNKYADTFDDLLDEWVAAQVVELNEKAIKRYDVFDIDMSQ